MPIQQEKIDVDHQVTRPREIYFGDGVRLIWKTVRTSGKFSSNVRFSILQI